jgi:chemotaxis protein methyltransferase CheR
MSRVRSSCNGRYRKVLCRNLVFTYFDESLQRVLLGRIKEVMNAGAALVIGIHERLPDGVTGFTVWSERLRIYRVEDGSC